MTDSIRQWKRHVQVVIGKNGEGLSVVDPRIQFEVTKTVKSTPNTAVIKIFNLNPTNEAQIKEEFDDVLLNAGYEGGTLLIFRGNIKHVYRYKDGADIITEIQAADGDKDFRTARMNETLAAGTTNAQLVGRAVGSFTGGTTAGTVQVKEKARIRGKVVTGNTRDILDTVARDSSANWSIQDGQLHIIGVDAVTPGEAVVLTSDTGLLGAPEVNDKGIAAKCLLNPQIKINGALKLDNNSVKAKKAKLGEKKKPGAEKEPIRLDPDGLYKVIKLVHKGDNRGPDWVTDTLSVGLSQPIPDTSDESEFEE